MNIRTQLKKSSKRVFGIHGGGNIGLGLMADVAAKSPNDYEIVATSNDKLLKKIVNSTHQLWLQHNASKRIVTHIKNVTIISRDLDDVVKLYKQSSILAICLTPSAMTHSANAIALGLIERYRSGLPDLHILVLMNLPNAAKVVEKTISQEIFSLLDNKEEAKKVCGSVKFIPTVVDRIVTKISEQDIKQQLRQHLISCISMDFVSPSWLNLQVNELLNNADRLALAVNQFNLQFSLFNAEKSFALYASRQVVMDELQLPSIQLVGNLEQLEAIKNKYINGPHAMIAWLGGLFGAKTIAAALQYRGLKQLIEKTMDQEIAPILLAEYPNLTQDELVFFKELFFERCQASIDDPVERVARDPLRKINSGERILGTIQLAGKAHKNMPMSGLELGIAAAILYAVKQIDATNPECRKIYELYHKNKSYADVLTYHGPYSGGTFIGLDAKRDANLIKNILYQIATLEKVCAQNALSKRPSQGAKQTSSTLTVMNNLCMKKTASTDTMVVGSRLSVHADLVESTEIPSPSRSAISLASSMHYLRKKSEETQSTVTQTQSYVSHYGRR